MLSYSVIIPPNLTIALPNDAFTFQVDWDGVVGKLLGFGIMVLELFACLSSIAFLCLPIYNPIALPVRMPNALPMKMPIAVENRRCMKDDDHMDDDRSFPLLPVPRPAKIRPAL